MFKMESRHLLDLSIQNTLDCISENFNLKNFHGGACTRTSLEKCPARSPDRRYCAHNATVYSVCRPPLSQNPLSAPGVQIAKWPPKETFNLRVAQNIRRQQEKLDFFRGHSKFLYFWSKARGNFEHSYFCHTLLDLLIFSDIFSKVLFRLSRQRKSKLNCFRFTWPCWSDIFTISCW